MEFYEKVNYLSRGVGWYFLLGLAPIAPVLVLLFINETFSIDFSINFQWLNVWYLLGALIVGGVAYRLYLYLSKDW